MENNKHGGLFRYDYGKANNGEYSNLGTLNKPNDRLQRAVRKVANPGLEDELLSFEYHAEQWLQNYGQSHEDVDSWRCPPKQDDKLFRPDYNHVGGSSCERCDPTKTVRRSNNHSNRRPQVHQGLIASGNTVIKDATHRDTIVKRCKESLGLGQILCFEMEGAGVARTDQCLVIKGICGAYDARLWPICISRLNAFIDYCDSHKLKQFQKYAAVNAAAFAKAVLLAIDPRKGSVTKNDIQSPDTSEDVAASGTLSPLSKRMITRRPDIDENYQTRLDMQLDRPNSKDSLIKISTQESGKSAQGSSTPLSVILSTNLEDNIPVFAGIVSRFQHNDSSPISEGKVKLHNIHGTDFLFPTKILSFTGKYSQEILLCKSIVTYIRLTHEQQLHNYLSKSLPNSIEAL
jgi:nucleoside phosphorylase